MSKKFPYGYDVNVYIDKAIEKMKYTYFWVKKDILDKRYTFSIEKSGNKYQYYYTYEDNDKRVIEGDGEEFINQIIWFNEWAVEDANPVKDVFEVPGQEGKCSHGWYLERYEFRSHVLGGYSVFCQAGDRTTGGSRTFFIPNEYFDGTYYEFLDKYIELVPPHFGFTKEELSDIPELANFLGFKED